MSDKPTEEIVLLTTLDSLVRKDGRADCFRGMLKKITTEGIIVELPGGLKMDMTWKAKGTYTWQGSTYAVFSALDTAQHGPMMDSE